MNSLLTGNALRFFLILLVQGLVLASIQFEEGWLRHFRVLLYPVVIMLMPLRTPATIVIAAAFAMGLAVDLFYATPGVHAAALTFMAFCRNFVLGILEPRGGYNVNFSPTIRRLGRPWFLRYSSILLFLHVVFYACVDVFTFVYWDTILLNIVGTYLISWVFIFMYMLVFNPED